VISAPPPDWTGADAPTQGAVLIPDHVDPTNPRRVYELDDPAERKYLYEIVLTDGTAADVKRFIARSILVDLWGRLYLPASIRTAWADTVTWLPGGDEAAATSAAADVVHSGVRRSR